MKILGLIGGRKGFFTEGITKLALNEAIKEGAEVEVINISNLNLKPCIGCSSCIMGSIEGGSGKCIIKNDDFEWLEEKYLQSDALFVCMPAFEKCVPGYYKNLCDRMGPGHDVAILAHAKRIRKMNNISDENDPDERHFKERAAVFIGHGGSEWSQTMIPTLSHFAVPHNLKVVDQIHIDWNITSLSNPETLERIKESGRHLARTMKKPLREAKYIGMRGQCPICHNDVFVLREDPSKAECSLCGMIGTLKIECGKVSVEFAKEQYALSHMTITGKQHHLEDIQGFEKAFQNPATISMQKILKEACSTIVNTKPQR